MSSRGRRGEGRRKSGKLGGVVLAGVVGGDGVVGAGGVGGVLGGSEGWGPPHSSSLVTVLAHRKLVAAYQSGMR